MMGPEHVTYEFATWWDIGGAFYPVSAVRSADGVMERSRAVFPGPAAIVPSVQGVRLTVPDTALTFGAAEPAFSDTAPDTVRIASNSFLLVSPAFTEVVALARDTVWIFDATVGDVRARQDSSWIARLFPGTHPVALVVMNMAWPHFAGVRSWVAHGATIYSHPGSEAFLRRIIARDWSAYPDALERSRRSAEFRFRAVRDSMSVGGGAILLSPIDGISGEGALMAALRKDGFIWASDHVQDLDHHNLYVSDLRRTAHRLGLTPRTISGPHMRLRNWSSVEALEK